MVARVYTTIPAAIRYQIANVMIWIGVLVWVPFILLRVSGEKPNIFWFLPFHLLGVVGGSRLKSAPQRELGDDAPKNTLLRKIGHILVFTGIMVWVVYFFLKLVAHYPVEVNQFLPYHLMAMLSGVAILLINFYRERKKVSPKNFLEGN